MKTKVVQYIGRIQDGGAETIVKDYALALVRDNFDVYVICRDYVKTSSIYKTLIKNNIKIVSMYKDFNYPDRLLARILGIKYVSNKLSKVLNDIKPDVIHCHLECLESLFYAKESIGSAKLLFTCHNLPKMCIGEDNPKEQEACKYFIKHNNMQIIALHDDMAKEINSMFNINNTAVIKNGIDFNRFKNVAKSKEEIRESLGINKDAYVVGQVGRFAYQKNPEFTVSIFSELLKKKSNSYLLLIGRGKDEEKLRKQISDLGISNNVLLLTNREDIPELLKAMDVFVLPSRFEGLGIVLIEAQVAGLPCLTSNNIPLEAYQSKNTTRLSLEDSKDKWVEALLNPIGNIDKFGNIEDYDMNKQVKKLEMLYTKKDIV